MYIYDVPQWSSFALEPVSLEETDVIMEEGDLTDHWWLPLDANTPSPVTAVSNLHLEGENSLRHVVTHPIDDYAASATQFFYNCVVWQIELSGTSHVPKTWRKSILVKAEAYPPLPPPQEPVPTPVTCRMVHCSSMESTIRLLGDSGSPQCGCGPILSANTHCCPLHRKSDGFVTACFRRTNNCLSCYCRDTSLS